MKNKKYALQLLKEKINGERLISFVYISELSGYSEKQIRRWSKDIENKYIDSLLTRASKGKTPNNAANNSELEYLNDFKKQYPNISISQFMDIYHEDIIFSPNKLENIYKYNLKKRSYSFFKDFYRNNGYKSPRKHKCFKGKNSHHLSEASPKRGILIMIAGTPHDWFENGKKFSLHLAIDDATGEILAGWFMPTECLEGYCYMLKILIQKYGIPENIYSDKHTIFKSPVDGNLTQFGRICEELGINMIFAETAEAFAHTIRAEYRKKVYSTRQIAGHRQDPVKRQQKIQNQKELDEYLRLQNKNN